MSKIKIGDKVEIINSFNHCFKKHEIVVIKEKLTINEYSCENKENIRQIVGYFQIKKV